MRRKCLCGMLVLAMLMTVMTGCGGGKDKGPASGEKTKITFMGWGYESEKAVFTKMIQDFQTKYPDIEVKYIVAPSAEYDTKLNAMIQAGTEPDVFFMKPENLMAWAQAEKILNVQSYLEASEDFDVNNIWPQALDRYRFDGEHTGKGDLWAFPKDVGPWAMVYNKKIFEERGVTPPTRENPWTWSEFVENAKKLTYTDASDRQIYGTGYYMLETAVWSNGADFIDESATKVTVDTPEFAQAMQWVADLRLVDAVMPSTEEEASIGAYARWLNGTCAMFAMGPWDQEAFWKLDFEWDLMPWPVSDTTQKAVPYLGSAGFAISAGSENKDAAVKLASYFSMNVEGQRTNYEMGQAVPNLIDMANDEYLKMDKAPASKEIFFDIIENGRGYSQEETYNGEWLAEFWLDANKVWTGEMTAADYCREVQPRMQELLDKAIKIQKENKK